MLPPFVFRHFVFFVPFVVRSICRFEEEIAPLHTTAFSRVVRAVRGFRFSYPLA